MTGDITRIRNKAIRQKIGSVYEAASIIESGMTIGVSVPEAGALSTALIERAHQSRNFTVNVWSATGRIDMDRSLGEAGIIKKRVGQQYQLRDAINAGKVNYYDLGLRKYCRAIRTREYGRIDIAIVEAIAINEDGNLIPSFSLLDTADFVEAADKVIVKLNPFYPSELEGMHDVYLRRDSPHQEPIPLIEPGGRIGTAFIPVGNARIACILVADAPDAPRQKAASSEAGRKIASNLVSFFRQEVSLGRLPSNLLPIEIGLGNIPDMVLEELCRSEFRNLVFFSSILSDGVIDLIDMGKVEAASGSALVLSGETKKKFSDEIRKYKKFIVLRPLEIAGSPELLARFDIMAINSVAEVDIYGHGNATHAGGNNIINGIGGLGEFAENASLSALILPSVAKNGNISNIVPMVPHVDVNEHHTDLIVTEQGCADVRGLSPAEKAEKIIENCAHPDYKPILRNYFSKAVKQGGGHEPHLLDEALSFHRRFLKTGSMKKPGRS